MTTTWVEALLRKQRETREHGFSPFPYQAAFLLDNPLRRAFFKPARVVESIGLTGSERVLELGPGPGFYSVEIARRLRGGRLELFDRARPDRRLPEGFSFHDLRHYLVWLTRRSTARIRRLRRWFPIRVAWHRNGPAKTLTAAPPTSCE
jgi:hypothetical protein